jgi:ferrochelatase
MSPLIEITRAQAEALEAVLGKESGWLRDARAHRSPRGGRCGSAARALVGLILSPQYSATLMGGYSQALDAAAGGLPSRTVEAWHLNPAFIDVLASRIRLALAAYPEPRRAGVPVLLTAHSLPRRVVDREPGYVEQLQETARAVAQAADLPDQQWSFVYQSAGHTPEEWLKPDMLDVLPELAREGQRDVVIAPVQFRTRPPRRG